MSASSLFESMGMTAAEGAVNADQLEREIHERQPPPPGVYHAILDEAHPPSSQCNGWKLIFKIIHGPESGKKVEEVLWKLKGDGSKGDEGGKKKLRLFAARLGVTKRDANNNLVEQPGVTFETVVGAQCFIDVINQPREYQGKDGKTRTITEAKLKFEGLLHPTEDKRVQELAKAADAVAQAAAAGAKAAAAKQPSQGGYANI